MSRGSLLALPVLIAATAVAAAAATENAADGGAAMMPLTAAAEEGQWDRRIRLSKRSVPDSAYDGDVGDVSGDEVDDFYPPAALSVADLARLWQIQQQQRDSQMRRRLYGSGGADGYSGVVLRPGADKRGYIRINKRGYIRINKRGHIRIVK